MREWPRRGTFDFCAVRFELAAVARARNHFGVGLPLSDATQMRADGGHCIEAFRHAHDVNLLVLKKRHRMHGIKIGIARAKGSWGLKQDVGRKILIGHGDGAEPGNSERAQCDFIQEVTPSDLNPRLKWTWYFRNRRMLCVTHEWSRI